MRVLFVVKELKMEPLGIMYLSAALKKAHHEVELVRCDCDVSPEEMVYEFQPDYVAYSVCSGLEDFYFDLDKKLHTAGEFQSIFGGPSVTFSPEKYHGREFIRGEGEKAIVDITEGRKTKDLELMDLDSLPFADREIAYQFGDLFRNPIKNILSRRGCKFGCSYCYNREWNRLHKGKLPKGIIRHRSVESVVREGIRIKSQYPVELINFVDDNFVSSLEWLRKFALDWKHFVGLPFFCSVRPDDVTRESMSLIALAGGKLVNLAIESANNENRKRVLTRTGTKEAVRWTIGLIKEYGMKSRLQNIIGLPVDDPLSDAYETLDFNIDCQPTTSWCALLQAYKGTKAFEIAKRDGYTDEDGLTDIEFFGTSTLKIQDKKKVERLHKIWHTIVRFPFLRKFVPILIRLPLPFLWFKWFFRVTKRWLAEREYWKVLQK